MLDVHAGDVVRRHGKLVGLHDESVFAVRIIARTRTEAREPECLVERLRALVADAHFERGRARAEVARIGRHTPDELARNTVATPCGIDAHFEDLHVAVDDEAARVAYKRRVSGHGHRRIGCVRRPPHAVGAPELIGHKCLVPRVASHHLRLEPRHITHVRRVEWLVGHTRAIGARVGDRQVVHGDVLAAARTRKLLVGFRQAHALGLLGVRQTRVDRQGERGIMTLRVEGVARARAPRVLQREQQTRPRGSPQLRGKNLAAALERVGVLFERIARDEQFVACRGRTCRVGSELVGRRRSLHHAVLGQAVRAGIAQRIANGIHLLAHGVSRHEHASAHARSPRVPRHGIERGDAHERHAERARDALRRCHGDAHARERSRAAPNRDARDLAARDTGIAQQLVHERHELGVRGAPRVLFARGNEAHRLVRWVEGPHTDRDNFVRGVEGHSKRALCHER